MFNIDRSWIENQILKKIKRYFQRGMGGGEGKKEKNLRAKSKKKKKKKPKEGNKHMGKPKWANSWKINKYLL